MSHLPPNSLSLYLRPLAHIEPYQINNCATWLVLKGKFPDYHSARAYLDHLENHNSSEFKNLMSYFFEQTDTKHVMISPFKNVNRYQSTRQKGSYGEPHMSWRMKSQSFKPRPNESYVQ